jgi:hypothetical protein
MPKKTSETKFIVSPEWLEQQSACQSGRDYATKKKGDAAKIFAQCPRGDWLIWFLRRTNKITLGEARQCAVRFAELSLPLIAKRFPDEKRPARCIEAVKAYLAHPSDENKKLMLAARCEASKARWFMWAAAAASADAAADAAWLLARQNARHNFYKKAAKIVREIVKNHFI